MKFCKYPFTQVYIRDNGEVIVCCYDAYTYVIGNIFEQDFEDIWYGEKAIEIRRSVLDGSYKYCSKNICPWNKWMLKEKNDSIVERPPYPELVEFRQSKSCNLRCIMCRDELFLENKEQTDFLNNYIDRFVDVCKNAKFVYMNGEGEFFTSNHLKLLTNTLVKKYPDLKFILHTNGLLCDEKHIKSFGLYNKIFGINISVHAAKKKTYEKIMLRSNFDRVIENIKYLCEYNKKNKLDYFGLIFVVSSLNYKEMPAFVRMANKFGSNVTFWRFNHDWKNSFCRDYKKYECWEPTHPKYKYFLKVLRKLKKMKESGKYNFIIADTLFLDIQSNIEDPWWIRLKKKIVGEKK